MEIIKKKEERRDTDQKRNSYSTEQKHKRKRESKTESERKNESESSKSKQQNNRVNKYWEKSTKPYHFETDHANPTKLTFVK
ncbi:Hypothetical predicted protein [Octopus vulgaris]|uniref:Uncharacterized protein n=1 Tax=Octopus vulgaris TaxID=6645 RepID=A0AA36BR47_OCTVU|nr:Hypothetical predicted protein [Octopus vulgaris]